MFENLKTMNDDEVINVINTIVTDNIDVELSDLKLILAEASGRKLEKKYINIIAERIKAKIQPEQVESRRNTEQVLIKPMVEQKKEQTKEETETVKESVKKENTKPTFDDLYSDEFEEEDEEYEKYPALSFISGLYKVFAWILLAGFIILSVIAGILYFKVPHLVCASIFVGIVAGLITFLSLYCLAESIRVKMDTEEHLRKIKEYIQK